MNKHLVGRLLLFFGVLYLIISGYLYLNGGGNSIVALQPIGIALLIIGGALTRRSSKTQ